MKKRLLAVILTTTVFSFSCAPDKRAQPESAPAEIALPALFTDHMVLQAGKPIRVWGSAAPGANVSVSLSLDGDGKSVVAAAATNADASGAFKAELNAIATSARPHTLRVISGGNERKVNDVLIGEVWIASGQSNMGWPLHLSDNGNDEIAAADHPLIRCFSIHPATAFTPKTDAGTKWVVCAPKTAAYFSAVAYFFGRELQKQLPAETPIGLIHTSWGGTPAQSWTSLDALEHGGFTRYVDEFNSVLAQADSSPERLAEYEQDLAAHLATVHFPDPSATKDSPDLAAPEANDSEWTLLPLPGAWEKSPPMKNLNGVVWFRKTIDIPSDWAGKPLTLNAGIIDDTDTTYFNGLKVGATAKKRSHGHGQRAYAIPADAVNTGAATIAIRVFNNFSDGGVTGGILNIAPADDSAPAIDLAGDWRCHIEHNVIELPRPLRPDEASCETPSVLYNAMIAPLVPCQIAGVIWYQGESNTGNAAEYETLFPSMINDWRTRWGYDFPFIWAQLANFNARNPRPEDTGWANLRNAQTKALALPRTAQAILIDIGEADNIHPSNKKDAGLRLALAARKVAYGHDVVHSGPAIKTVKSDGSALVLTFEHADGLHFRGSSSNNFAIAGDDGVFVWADAELSSEAGAIRLRASAVDNPVFVRYAWGDNPAASLYNASGLPAVPFSARTE